MCDVSLQWAKYPVKDNRTLKSNVIYQVPEGRPIRHLRDVHVLVLTSPPAIDTTLKYDNCVWISHYDTTFTIPGGVNKPKKNHLLWFEWVEVQTAGKYTLNGVPCNA